MNVAILAQALCTTFTGEGLFSQGLHGPCSLSLRVKQLVARPENPEL